MNTPLDIAAIRARAAAATPGPWTSFGVDVYSEDNDTVLAVGTADRFYAENEGADGSFIAAARTDVPALCDEVDHVRAELAGANAELARAKTTIEAVRTLVMIAWPEEIASYPHNSHGQVAAATLHMGGREILHTLDIAKSRSCASCGHQIHDSECDEQTLRYNLDGSVMGESSCPCQLDSTPSAEIKP